MSDFQKAVSALRSVGLEVTVEYKGFIQVATVKGEKMIGQIKNIALIEKVKNEALGIKTK